MFRLGSSRLVCFLFLIVFVLSSGFVSGQAPAVATGDSRTVTEPTFPATCQQVTATFHDVNDDVPASVEAVSTQLDLTRLQAALNACTGTNQAVELSMDGSGNNAFLTGPISIPSGVTLLVDAGVTLYFSRNAQDYDTTPGTHTCGTVNGASNTASCKNLITIKNANDAGIMGYGKMNARGGDVVLNSFVSTGYGLSKSNDTWWDLANDASTFNGSQQNPRWLQATNSNNLTLYKITLKNAPNFHIAISGGTGVTVWGIKIITPYNAHNTDGIDPSNGTNFTIRNVSVSDGDDNVAVGATNTSSPTSNFSIINNRFFAGHGESIGSITQGSATNILFDHNMMYGDAEVDGSNSTAIRIKSANDRGGLVTNVQYSNSCFANHGTQIQFNTLYNTTAGALTPNFQNILLQNLHFLNTGAVATGSVTIQGATNGSTVNPITVQFDNVAFDTLTSPTNFSSPNTNADIYQAHITLGPGAVSSNLATTLIAANGTNGNVVTGTGSGTFASPACVFTFLTPEITGPTAQTQTVTQGQFPTAVVILSPAMATAGSSIHPYPTGTVTVTDELSHIFTATLPGTGDTIFIPITNSPVGTHTYSASYSGDSVYAPITAANFGSTYTVTVNAGSLATTSLVIGGIPATTTYGTSFTATATLSGAVTPTGSISFLVNGAVHSTVPIASNAAAYTFSLPIGTYSISAAYNGDSANSASISTASPLAIAGAATTTVLSSSATSTTVGVPVALTATVTSGAGTPTGTVSFSYTNATVSTPITVISAALVNGVANASAFLPQGTDNLVATYVASGNFGGSVSTNTVAVTVNPTPPVPAATTPIVMPYTISTIAGGGTAATSGAVCPGTSGSSAPKAVDTAGDGCPATSIQLMTGATAGDMRSVTVDPFGNIYFTDGSAALVRKISTNGIVSDFAGRASNAPTSCTPTVSPLKGCNPVAVSLSSKPRGVYSDPFGNIYIAGYGNNLVHVVKVSDGLMYIAAGNGTAATQAVNGDGGLATSAELNQPRAVTTDAAGNIYIASTAEDRVREVLNPNSGAPGAGTITTVIGSGYTTAPIPVTPDDVDAVSATNLSIPQGVAVDASANIFVSTDSRVRAKCVTCTPGSALYSLLSILGYTHIVNGNIYTVAGTATSSSNPTLAPGLGNTVNMGPQKIVVDPNGNLYIADSANNVVWFEDGRTGYTRVIAGGGNATSCTGSAVGDGCHATQAVLGSNGGNGIGVGLDLQGNLYVSDSTNLRIRKISNNLRFGSSAVGTPVAQTISIHSLPGDTPITPTVTSPDFALSGVTCSVNAADTTTDCTGTATFTPAAAGPRSKPFMINTTLGNPGNFAFTGAGVGAGATVDPANQITFGTNVSPNALAVDSMGNVYVADAVSKAVLKFAPGAMGTGGGAAATSTVLQTFTNPSAVATDTLGNVFVADSSTGFVTQISPSGTSKTLSTIFSAPDGLAVDGLNNLYVADATAKTITQIGANQVASRTFVSAGLTSPAGIAADVNANLFVADSGAGAVIRVDAITQARTTISTAAATPRAVAVDVAGNLMISDSSTNQIIAVPSATGSTAFQVASGIPANALAMDGIGNIFTPSASNEVLELQRTQSVSTYNGTGTSPTTIALLSTGNVAANLSLTDPDTTNFSLALTTSASCTGSASALTVAPGGSCSFTSSFAPTARQNFTNTATFAGNAANALLATPPVLEIAQVGNNAPFAVTLAIGATSPVTPNIGDTVTLSATVSSTFGNPSGTVAFAVDGSALSPIAVSGGSASATIGTLTAGTHTITATFASSDPNFANATATSSTVTVQKLAPTVLLAVLNTTSVYGTADSGSVTISATSGTPTGTVQFVIDGANAGTPVAIASGVASFTLPTLTAGSHTIAASYSGDGTFTALTTSGISVTIAQATPTVTWGTPSSITYGTALGASQLNATASVPGVFVYTPAAGTILNASTMGQTLSVTFTPTDSTDYSTVTRTTTILDAKQGSTTALALSPTTLGLGQSVTFTATVTAATSGTPTGSVTFLDGTTVLGSSVIANGKAIYTTSALAVGTHTITANYGGDTNFNVSSAASATNAVTVTALDFTMTTTTSSVTVTNGTAANFTYQLSPTSGAYPGTVSFSVSGVPASATTTFTPATIAANGGAQSVQLSIATSTLNSKNIVPTSGAPIFLTLLLLPLSASRRFRTNGAGLGRLLMLALILISGAVIATAVSGCGGSAPKYYSVIVTVTSGTVSHGVTSTLTVQ